MCFQIQLPGLSLIGNLYSEEGAALHSSLTSNPGAASGRVLRALDDCIASKPVQVAAVSALQVLSAVPTERAAIVSLDGVLRVLRALDMHDDVRVCILCDCCMVVWRWV